MSLLGREGMSLFEKATRTKLRFKHKKGMIGVEDLWDLKLKPDLDELAQASHKKLQDTVQSFVDSRSKTDAEEQLRMDLLKHVIGVKLAEQQAKKDLQARKEKKNRIMEIMAAKQDEELKGKSLADLQKMMDEL
jgi:hypothetical protein